MPLYAHELRAFLTVVRQQPAGMGPYDGPNGRAQRADRSVLGPLEYGLCACAPYVYVHPSCHSSFVSKHPNNKVYKNDCSFLCLS